MKINVAEKLEILCRIQKVDTTVVSGIWLTLNYEEISRLSELLSGTATTNPPPSSFTQETARKLGISAIELPKKHLF